MPSAARRAPAIALVVSLAGAGCGDDLRRDVPTVPTVPLELTATGSLRTIHLGWSAQPGATGYLVYRSTDDTSFARLIIDPIAATAFDDPIESPAGDGAVYSYRVTAVTDTELPPSNIARAMHGTRLEAAYPEGFSTRAEDSPYVADGRTTLGGDLGVSAGTKLYVRAGAAIDLEAGHLLLVNGLLRAVGSPSAPVVFTAHQRGGGVLPDSRGFHLVFDGVAYDPNDASGSLLDHVLMTNVAGDDPGLFPLDLLGGLEIRSGGIALDHVKVSVNGNGAMVLNGGWVILRSSYLDGLRLSILGDLRDTPFEATRNVLRGGVDALLFEDFASPPVSAGQITANDLDGHLSVVLRNVIGTAIPLGGNYWGGANGSPPMPFVFQFDGSTATVDFQDPSGPLGAPPAGAGPDW